MTTALLPRPIIDPNAVEATALFFQAGTEITDRVWLTEITDRLWLTELDDIAALVELENRLEPLSRYMAALN
jgi:hypothetical protein